MTQTINFDMDGTLANFYGVDGWLDYLESGDTTPYATAKPLLRFSELARTLNELQKNGFKLAIISWTSKSGTADYNAQVTKVKYEWLEKHLPSVHWDEIHIVPYGTPKQNFAHSAMDILFDDEDKNRNAWTGKAFAESAIMTVLKDLKATL